MHNSMPKVVTAGRATMQADSQAWGTEQDIAEALRGMPVPVETSVAAVFEFVQRFRAMLFMVPPGALVDLCRRVVQATQGLLQQATPAESQAIPANEQMQASAMVCLLCCCCCLQLQVEARCAEVLNVLKVADVIFVVPKLHMYEFHAFRFS